MTPEHAAFAIQLVTNPHWTREDWETKRQDRLVESHMRLLRLLEEHRELLDRNAGANSFALLAMRTALRMGDPEAARRLGESVAPDAAVRTEPDFLWMLASTRFLARDYAAAEEPLLALFRSPRADKDRRAAAAYGLCGVYWKTENRMEQLRYALWLHTEVRARGFGLSYPSEITDFTVYWTFSGWDLGLLLETEAPVEVLQAFIDQNPNVPDIRLVKYSLAVRLTREERYEEAAKVYEAIHAVRRAPRLRQLAALYEHANRPGLKDNDRLEARYKLAEFIEAHENGIYFNDALWNGYQSYVFKGAKDSRLTRAERETLIAQERKLKDDQEEYWRAYLILRRVAQEAGKTELGRKASALGVHCLMKINERFGREKEIRTDARELAKLVR